MGKNMTGFPALAAVMRKHREKVGMSQNALGVAAKVHTSTIWKIEAGRRGIGIEALERLTVLLGPSFNEEAKAAMAEHHGY